MQFLQQLHAPLRPPPSPPPPGNKTLLVTADHSPESVREFERMRLTHPAGGRQQQHQGPQATGGGGGGGGGGKTAPASSDHNRQQQPFSLPSLLVVYDSPTSNKLKCSPVFEVDVKGTPRVTNKGR